VKSFACSIGVNPKLALAEIGDASRSEYKNKVIEAGVKGPKILDEILAYISSSPLQWPRSGLHVNAT
jgi:hypothetical protein